MRILMLYGPRCTVQSISDLNLSELHDKIIVATAKYLELPLITKDTTIQKLSTIRTIW